MYNNIIYSGQEISGNIPKGLLPANYPLSNIVPSIDIKGYLHYKSMPLPDTAALRDVGLLSRIYANDSGASSGTYVIGNNTLIKGNGVLYSGNPINIRQGCNSRGKLWLICNDKIIIGDDVKLKHAFLFAKGSIYIGRNVSIYGIIVSAGKIELGDGFIMRGDNSVLEKIFYFLLHELGGSTDEKDMYFNFAFIIVHGKCVGFWAVNYYGECFKQ